MSHFYIPCFITSSASAIPILYSFFHFYIYITCTLFSSGSGSSFFSDVSIHVAIIILYVCSLKPSIHVEKKQTKNENRYDISMCWIRSKSYINMFMFLFTL